MTHDTGNDNGRHDGLPAPWAVGLSDRLPPHNLDAERGVLGGILVDNNVLPEVVRFLAVDDFYRDAHQVVYRAMLELHGAGRPVDAVTLADLLERRNQLEQIGGDDGLCAIAVSVPHAANAKYHAQIVREKSIARAIAAESEVSAREAGSNLYTGDELLARARGRLEGLWPSGGEPWPELALQVEPASKPFPAEVFPLALQRFCQGVARVTLCPVDLVGAAMLAVASAAIGQSSHIYLRRTWRESPLLYMVIVAEPGSKKSPAIRLVTRPLVQIDAHLRQSSKDSRALWESMKKSLPKGETAPEEPPQLRAIVKDVTRETLAAILRDNPRGLLADPDEATAWVSSFNEYKSKGSDRQFWLSIWGGGSVSVDREGGRRSIYVRTPLVSVIAGIPPDMLSTLDESQGRNDGFRDRLLFCYPESFPEQVWTDEELDQGDEMTWAHVVETLYAQDMVREPTGELRPHLVEFQQAAKAAFVRWFDAHNAECKGVDLPPACRSVWSKLEAYCARLVLILSRLRVVMDPECRDPLRPPVEVEDVERAIDLLGYFKASALRVLHQATGGTFDSDAKAILGWVKRGERTEFSLRDIRHDMPGRFASQDSPVNAISVLRRLGVIRLKINASKVSKTGRKGSLSYDVHPDLLTS